MFDNLFNESTGSTHVAPNVQTGGQAKVLPQNNGGAQIFGNLFNEDQPQQVNPFAKLNTTLNDQAKVQPQKTQQPKQNNTNVFQGVENFFGNLFNEAGKAVKPAADAVNGALNKAVNSPIGNGPSLSQTYSQAMQDLAGGSVSYAPAKENQQGNLQQLEKTQQQRNISDPVRRIGQDTVDTLLTTFQGATGNVFKSPVKNMSPEAHIIEPLSEMAGQFYSIEQLNKGIGGLLGKTPLITAFPEGSKLSFIPKLITNVASFDIYGQIDPGVKDRLKQLVNDTEQGTLFTVLGAIGKVQYSVPLAFAGGVGLAKLNGADNKDALSSGLLFAALDLAGKVPGLFDSQFKTGAKEFTPQEARDFVINSPYKNTEFGKDIMKDSFTAEQQGKNIKVNMTAAKQGIGAKVFKMDGSFGGETPSGTQLSYEMTDAPQKITGETHVNEKPVDNTKAVLADETNIPSKTELPTEYEAQRKTPFDTKDVIDMRNEQETIPETFKVNTPERKQFRQDVADRLYENGGYNDSKDRPFTGEVKAGRRADIVIGPPAAGKSSVFVEPLAKEHQSFVLDNDEAKKGIPESQGALYAGPTHRESAHILDDLVTPRVLSEGKNIVYATVGRNVDALREMRDGLKELGYEVHLHLNEVSKETAAQRAIERFHSDHRFVDPDYVYNTVGGKPSEIYDIIKTEGFKTYDKYSNEVPRGEKPRLIDRGVGKEGSSELQRTVNSEINKEPSQEKEVPRKEVNPKEKEYTDTIREALYSGDEEAAKALHDVYSSEIKTLPSFDSLRKEINTIHTNNLKEVESVKRELETLPASTNPEDPTNQLKDIARKLSDHFSRPKASYKITGNERTYKSSDGHTMIVGGNATEAFDRLIHATDIEGFKNNIRTLHEKFDGVFTQMYSSIRKGAIDGADYEQFKKYYESIQGKRLPASNRNKSVANSKADVKSVKSTTGGTPIQSSSNTESETAENSTVSDKTISTPQRSESGNTESGEINRTSGNGSSIIAEEPSIESKSVQLNAGIDPGLQTYFESDLKPSLLAIKDAGKESFDLANPPLASDSAKKASNIIRESLSKIDTYKSIVGNKYTNYRRFFDKFSAEDGVKNISAYERTGQFEKEPNPIKGDPSYSKLYHDSMVESYKALRAAYGKDEEGFIENYVRRAFSFPNEEEAQKGVAELTNYSRSLSGSKSPLKKRVLEMPLDEALKNMQERDIKVEIKSTNPEELRQWSLINAKKALVFSQAWKELKQGGLIKFVPRSAHKPTNMIKLEDRVATTFAPAEVHYPAKGGGFQEKGHKTMLEMGTYYADPTVARILNNTISKGVESNKLFRAARVIENTLNQFQLGLSAFHLTGSALNAGFSDVALGLRNVLQGRPYQAGIKITRGLIPFASFSRDIYKGSQFLNDLKNNSPEAYQVMEKYLNPAGGRLEKDERYNMHMVRQLNKALLNGNPIGALVRVPSAITEVFSHLLMDKAIPRVKIAAFLDLAENVYSRLPEDATIDQKRSALSNAWNSIDNRFGQLVYDNLFWNKIGKDIALLSTRSVGWNLGDFRELGGGIVVDPIKTMLLGKGRINNKLSERFTDRMLFSAALILGVSTLGAIYQYLHTGQGPTELKDYFFPKNGLRDKNGNPDRSSLPTYWKDLYAFSNNPVSTVLHKASPMIDIISSLINNKDYYGNLIVNPDDPKGTQLAQAGSYMLHAMFPFSFQQVQQQLKLGANPEQMAESIFGIVKAPGDVVQSDQQKALLKAYQQQMGLPGPKTPEQIQVQNLKNQARTEIQKNGWKSSPAFQELMHNGTLKTQQQRRDFIKSSSQTSTQRMESHLPKSVRAQLHK